ncbi:MAG: hypothetical protein EKK64_03510 [Neisseriaceae bacterium]|nr:MAG: hypothetical protein EKK64_03510 [Neisseriaceae bacterium]
MNDNNNGIAFIVLTILGFVGIIALIFAGKMILEQTQEKSNREIYIKNQIEEKIYPQSAPVQIQRPIVIEAPAEKPKEDCSKYHNNNLFWNGYKDGWDRIPPKSNEKEYMAGYDIGRNDRRRNCKDYLNHHCPPGLNIKFKGFNLNIK